MNVEDATNYLSEDSTHYTYSVGGSLPANNPTYVKRKADEQLYQKLKNGEFCYVLNSRQMGKSSLRVRTMQRLIREGVDCVEIDLTQIGNSLSKNEWYASIAFLIVMSFQSLSLDEFNDWWEKRKELSPLQKLTDLFSHFILKSTPHPIVIFVDEIDNVIDLDFSLDDFFAFIRYCYNHRVDNPDYNRLTFCLLGVATPSELIQKKHITPFNIGTGVELTGFTPEEAIPILSPGLASVVDNPEQVLTEVLHWTGGQPFLTQKLCRLIVENSALNLSNGKGSEEFVNFLRAQIIENWESKDEPEHLKTIRDRVIKRSEQRASYLLELYQKIWHDGEVTVQNTPEEAELQLSGLVVNRQGKLQVYNPIYREVFNDKWIEAELASLRPYAEAFRGWIASGEQDKSRLLRGKALEDAEAWAEGKELSFQDKQFLAASREQKIQEEIEENQRQAQLEQEKKDREAAEKRNVLLVEANQKAKKLIRSGSIILVTTLLGALGVSWFSARQITNINRLVVRVNQLVDLGVDLFDNGKEDEAKESWGMAGHSFKIRDKNLQQALLLSQISLVYQEQEKLEEAEKAINESLNLLKNNIDYSIETSQILVHAYFTYGKLHQLKQRNKEAVQSYQKAINILDLKRKNILTKGISILTKSEFQQASKIYSLTLWEATYLQYMKLLNKSDQESVRTTLISLQDSHLEYLLRSKQWKDANLQTHRMMIVVAEKEREGYLSFTDIENFSCPTLHRLENLWYGHSDGNYGFRRQKEMYLLTGNKLDGSFSEKHWIEFLIRMGWAGAREDADTEAGREYIRYHNGAEWEVGNDAVGQLPYLYSENRLATVAGWSWFFRWVHKIRIECSIH